MGFDGLLGNRRLKDNLKTGLRQGRLSHFYLISGPRGSGKRTLARLLSAAFQCSGSDKPCLSCPACRKVLAGTHPDVICVEDPEHKTVAVKLVRQMREDMFIRPNEGDKKIYIFPQELGVEGQNALLKILEEPPSYGVYLLLTENPNRLLPTVRSRCVTLEMQSLPESILQETLKKEFPEADVETLAAAIARSGGYLGQARELLQAGETVSPQTEGFVKSMVARDAMGLLRVLIPMEKWKRDQLLPVLEQWAELVQQALVCRNGVQVLSGFARELGNARSPEELMHILRCLKKTVDYIKGNVSPAAICGYLAWALRESK